MPVMPAQSMGMPVSLIPAGHGNRQKNGGRSRAPP